jgi:hypothetical protein
MSFFNAAPSSSALAPAFVPAPSGERKRKDMDMDAADHMARQQQQHAGMHGCAPPRKVSSGASCMREPRVSPPRRAREERQRRVASSSSSPSPSPSHCAQILTPTPLQIAVPRRFAPGAGISLDLSSPALFHDAAHLAAAQAHVSAMYAAQRAMLPPTPESSPLGGYFGLPQPGHNCAPQTGMQGAEEGYPNVRPYAAEPMATPERSPGLMGPCNGYNGYDGGMDLDGMERNLHG